MTLSCYRVYQSARANGWCRSCAAPAAVRFPCQSDRVPRLVMVTFGVSRYTRELFQLCPRHVCSGPRRVMSGQNVNSNHTAGHTLSSVVVYPAGFRVIFRTCDSRRFSAGPTGKT